MRAQVAMEYLIILGFILALLVPLISLFYNQSAQITKQVNTQQALTLGQKIADAAESVHYLGPPSKFQFQANVPEGIKSVTFSNKEITFIVDANPGTTDVVVPSSTNITGSISISAGIHLITVQSQGNYVSVNST
jgi:type II secretory pathway pseudopilin PulG